MISFIPHNIVHHIDAPPMPPAAPPMQPLHKKKVPTSSVELPLLNWTPLQRVHNTIFQVNLGRNYTFPSHTIMRVEVYYKHSWFFSFTYHNQGESMDILDFNIGPTIPTWSILNSDDWEEAQNSTGPVIFWGLHTYFMYFKIIIHESILKLNCLFSHLSVFLSTRSKELWIGCSLSFLYRGWIVNELIFIPIVTLERLIIL